MCVLQDIIIKKIYNFILYVKYILHNMLNIINNIVLCNYKFPNICYSLNGIWFCNEQITINVNKNKINVSIPRKYIKKKKSNLVLFRN